MTECLSYGTVYSSATYPHPDPNLFVIDLQDGHKKYFLPSFYFAYYVLKVHLHHLLRLKRHKEV